MFGQINLLLIGNFILFPMIPTLLLTTLSPPLHTMSHWDELIITTMKVDSSQHIPFHHLLCSETGERNMKEVYDQYCIPVFGAPLTPMGRWNKYSCDFLNVIPNLRS
jgi:hypothetical protein